MITLEAEFEHYKRLHKYYILRQRLIEVFDKELSVNIPSFLNHDLENKIDYCIVEIARMGKYNELYELAWNETKQKFA